jgi:hypothetical protein
LSVPGRNEISTKLRRLSKEFLLAVINTTAILVMIAAILALVAVTRVDNFAGRVASTMTEAVLSRIDLPSKDVLANLASLREEVRSLGDTIREVRARDDPILQSKIAGLTDALDGLNVNLDRLANAKTILTDEAIERLGRSVTDTLTNMRDCVPRGKLEENSATEATR